MILIFFFEFAYSEHFFLFGGGRGRYSKETKSVMWKSQNAKWEIDGNNNREDDMEGREMKYMSNKEFSKILGQMGQK